MPEPVSFRLKEEIMSILLVHQSDLETAKGGTVTLTDSLEDIILQFANRQKTILSKIRKKLQPKGDSNLDLFLKLDQMAQDQLDEARH